MDNKLKNDASFVFELTFWHSFLIADKTLCPGDIELATKMLRLTDARLFYETGYLAVCVDGGYRSLAKMAKWPVSWCKGFLENLLEAGVIIECSNGYQFDPGYFDHQPDREADRQALIRHERERWAHYAKPPQTKGRKRVSTTRKA